MFTCWGWAAPDVGQSVRRCDYEIEGASVDADDDKYFAAAVEGSATLIVTGDPDLLTVKEFRGIRIVTPRVFLGLLGG